MVPILIHKPWNNFPSAFQYKFQDRLDGYLFSSDVFYVNQISLFVFLQIAPMEFQWSISEGGAAG